MFMRLFNDCFELKKSIRKTLIQYIPGAMTTEARLTSIYEPRMLVLKIEFWLTGAFLVKDAGVFLGC